MRVLLFRIYWSEHQLLFPFNIILVIRLFFQVILPVIFFFKNVKTFTEVWMHKLKQENHVFNPWWNKNLMTPSISRLQSYYKEKVYFSPFSSQEFQVLNWSISEGWNAELTLQPLIGFKSRNHAWIRNAVP